MRARSPSARAGSFVRRWWLLGVFASAMVVFTISVGVLLRGEPPRPSKPVILSSGEWAPYVGSKLADGGPLSRVVTSVFNRIGYQPDVRLTTWSLAEESARRGESVGIFPMVGSADRRKKFVLSAPLTSFDYVLFYAKERGAPDLADPAALSRYKVARIAGYDYWPALERNVGKFIEFPNSGQAFEALAAGQVDLVPEGRLPGLAFLSSTEFEYDVTAFDHVRGNKPWTASREELFLMVPRGSEAARLIPRFNATLQNFKKSLEYKTIMGVLEAGDTRQTVLLGKPSGDAPALRSTSGKLLGPTPHGTSAQVIEWHHPDRPGQVWVKVIDGPLAGRVGSIGIEDIRMGARP